MLKRSALVLPLLLGAAVLPANPSTPAQATAVPSPAAKVAKLTGPESINDTERRFALKSTDLGILWDNGAGEILSAFGDSYGSGWTGPGGGVGDPATLDWRCNLLLRSKDRHLADGMTFDSAAEDRPGHAGQFLDCKKVDRDEHTVIPTAGIAVGRRQYVQYMSVNYWGPAGSWFTNHSGFAYSDDNGETWTKDPNARWTNTAVWNSNFQMTALVRDRGHVYMIGTPNGRFGNAYLARVPEHQVLSKRAWRYWDGRTWSPKESAAVPVVAGPVSEVSVQWNAHLGKWLMLYLDESRASVVLRSASALTGPWSGERVVAKGTDFPGLYGTYIHPWSSGQDLYFTMSQWDPYNVFLMHTKLTDDGRPTNLVTDPGFEEQTGTSPSPPWQLNGRGGIDSADLAHTGARNAYLRDSIGAHSLQQTVAVRPHHRYRLSAWVRTAENNRETVLGVRTLRGRTVAEKPGGAHPQYTRVSVEFTSGRESLVQLYAGFFGPGQDVWYQLDDVVLEEIR
ncbi:carbohydrate-binding protein [Kribbella flavida DSM 17836]|uniref:Carbohydrate-binding protein n=1 Tax=Kribbella flavida (strain DSM 17836 / JCM 10339 / NBRC 14399) TaxID=479435 RepID=D2PTC0_KRIFD|nr:DUF4185 domain-containing protein [Kribbella flavida]ADB29436.1 carbohydrate-binding protein [Kribbella flavida DSM 17836]